jgi:hypothetical protein
MADIVIPDESVESGSMAMEEVTASDDGWDTESTGTLQVTPPADPQNFSGDREEAEQEQPEPPDAVDEDHDDAAGEGGDEHKQEAGQPHERRKLTAKERKGLLQAQFHALTRENYEIERSIAARKAELAALESGETERATARAAKTETKPLEPEPVSADDEPDWDTYEAEGKSFTEFQKAHSRWLRETVSAEATARANKTADERVAQERARAEEVAIRARFDARLEQMIEAHPDFEELAKSLDDVDGETVRETPFIKAVVFNHPKGAEFLYHLASYPNEALILSSLPMTRPIMDAVKASSDPTALLSFFAQNQEEHARIAGLPPASALLALGRLTAELSVSGAKNGSPAQTPPITTAKPPIRPIGTTRSAGASRGDDLESVPFGPEYVRRVWERDNKHRI